MPKHKKSAFTLTEVLVCLVLISIIGVAFIRLASHYYTTSYQADYNSKAFMQNMNVIEYAKANVKTEGQLEIFQEDYPEDDGVTVKPLTDYSLVDNNLRPSGYTKLYKITANMEYREKILPGNEVSAIIRVK